MAAQPGPAVTSSPSHCLGHSMPAVSSGILQGDFPLDFALPLLTLQVALVLLVTRSMAALFKPMKQPRVLAEIIGGVLLGPTALGRNKVYMEKVFPAQSLPMLDTVANIGLMFFIFMVGLELDLRALRKTGKDALLVGAIGIAVPFGMSAGLAKLVQSTISKGVKLAPLIVFLGIPLSISAFSVLVRIMAEVKLLETGVGKVAVAAAAVNDVTIWTLLAVGVAMAGGKKGGGEMKPVWVVMSAIGFGIVMVVVVRKAVEAVVAMAMAMAKKPVSDQEQKEDIAEVYVSLTMVSVMIAGCCSDAIGVHPLLGPFLLGLIVPKATAFPRLITQKLEDIVTGLLLPLFFASSGLKTDLGVLHGASSAAFLLLFFAIAAAGKVSSTFLAARLLLRLPPRHSLLLSFLMNTKGLGVLIVLNIGRDVKALSNETFAILVVTCLLTTCTTTPIVMALSRPMSFQSSNTADHLPLDSQEKPWQLASTGGIKSELRILCCAHHMNQNMAAIANLLEACRASSSCIKLHALRLLQLSDRPSDIFDILTSAQNLPIDSEPQPEYEHHRYPEQDEQYGKEKDEQGRGLHDQNSNNGNTQNHQKKMIKTESCTDAKHPGEQQLQPMVSFSFHDSPHLCTVDVTPLTAIAHLHSLHLDICKLAARHDSSIVLLPHLTLDDQNALINQKVLDYSPCSVGILVEQSSSGTIPIQQHSLYYNVLVLFIGGEDDREALTFASRMFYHPKASVKVLRFLDSSFKQQRADKKVVDQGPLAAASDQESLALDDALIARLKAMSCQGPSFSYEEHEYNNGNLLDHLAKVVSQTRDEVSLLITGRRRRPDKNDEGCDSYLGCVGDVISTYVCSLHSQACALVFQSRPSIRYVGNC